MHPSSHNVPANVGQPVFGFYGAGHFQGCRAVENDLRSHSDRQDVGAVLGRNPIQEDERSCPLSQQFWRFGAQGTPQVVKRGTTW